MSLLQFGLDISLFRGHNHNTVTKVVYKRPRGMIRHQSTRDDCTDRSNNCVPLHIIYIYRYNCSSYIYHNNNLLSATETQHILHRHRVNSAAFNMKISAAAVLVALVASVQVCVNSENALL